VFHDRGAEPLQGRRGVGRARRAAGGYATEEDQIIVVAGVPFNVQGSTNILRVAPCAERLIYATDPE
jgi:pyruvate kinase